jgi:hypothetical protein
MTAACFPLLSSTLLRAGRLTSSWVFLRLNNGENPCYAALLLTAAGLWGGVAVLLIQIYRSPGAL